MSNQNLRDIFEQVLQHPAIALDSLPPLDLYMDQVLTLINQPGIAEGEKGLTKSMINNYSKEGLIDPVKGKKYNTDQLLQIFLICVMKPSLSMNHIKIVMNALREEEAPWPELYQHYLNIKNEKSAGLASIFEQTMPTTKDLSITESSLLVLLLCTTAAHITQIAERIVKEELPPLIDQKKKESVSIKGTPS